MRIIGLDYGDARIGVAVSDSLGLTAQPLAVFSEKSWRAQISKIAAAAAEYDAEKIVIGMPKNMDGTIGPRGELTRKFEALLKENCSLPIVEWDERLTSVAAHRALTESHVRGVKTKGKVDMIAAVFILQGYLDSLRKED